MRIDKIHLREVGPFDDVEIDFPPGTDPNAADVYLLTGPNGCGKSTILYAIASAIAGGQVQLQQSGDPLALRLRNAMSAAAVSGQGDHLAVTSWDMAGLRRDVADKLGDSALVQHGQRDGLSYLGGRQPRPYSEQAAGFRVDSPWERFTWAAFAYSGIRSVGDIRSPVIEEPKHSPFGDSLSFIATANAGQLVDWIANQEFKALKAAANGRPDRAEQLRESRGNIERCVSEILGVTFAFDTNDEDNRVRVQLDGKVVSFEVLPDGLKSIVSWVADLLMRLDRIPWVDDVPPMKRSFLLLLDEIDIHLHPAWQRKVLPIVQRMFPNAQIIASTHSPFVVASADDAHIIALDVKDGVASLAKVYPSQRGKSYGAILHSIFGIASDFDTDTEALFEEFRAQRNLVLADPDADRTQLDALAAQLSERGEELTELVRIELAQVKRVLRRTAAP